MFAPNFCAVFKIFGLSLLNQVKLIFLDFNDFFIDQKIRGFFLIFKRFLFFIPFEPPLARIMECIIFFS